MSEFSVRAMRVEIKQHVLQRRKLFFPFLSLSFCFLLRLCMNNTESNALARFLSRLFARTTEWAWGGVLFDGTSTHNAGTWHNLTINPPSTFGCKDRALCEGKWLLRTLQMNFFRNAFFDHEKDLDSKKLNLLLL